MESRGRIYLPRLFFFFLKIHILCVCLGAVHTEDVVKSPETGVTGSCAGYFHSC